MPATLQQLHAWLAARENEHLEFKEAKSGFHFEKLAKYCAALANEGGGSIVLGVTDRRPRRVVRSAAFENIERTKAGLVERLRLRIEANELQHPDGRVLVFTAPPRPIGVPVGFEGAYWMRAGEDLVVMTPDMLRRIFDETAPDFSAEVCKDATRSDLDGRAIKQFRRRWHGRSKVETLLTLPDERLLRDAELITERGVTYAALIMLGTRKALRQHLANAEVVFEYRSRETPGPASYREEFQCGFLLYYDRVWELIDSRNDDQHYQYRFIMYPVPTFSEFSVREALLNAVAHRDYRHQGSIFVRQYAQRLEVVSPGGLPAGITLQNILYRQNPRNRRLADTFARCGLVDRAGQGTDRIFEEAIRQGKALPDFTHTDGYQVWLTLRGGIEDEDFLKFLTQIEDEKVGVLTTQDFLVLDCVRRGRPVRAELRKSLRSLIELGLIGTAGSGRGVHRFLSPRLYVPKSVPILKLSGQEADRSACKRLLLNHVITHSDQGTKFDELREVLPTLSRDQLQTLMKELKAEGVVVARGTTKGSRWYPADQNAIERKSVESN